MRSLRFDYQNQNFTVDMHDRLRSSWRSQIWIRPGSSANDERNSSFLQLIRRRMFQCQTTHWNVKYLIITVKNPMTSISLQKSAFLFVRSYSIKVYAYNEINISLSSSKMTYVNFLYIVFSLRSHSSDRILHDSLLLSISSIRQDDDNVNYNRKDLISICVCV